MLSVITRQSKSTTLFAETYWPALVLGRLLAKRNVTSFASSALRKMAHVIEKHDAIAMTEGTLFKSGRRPVPCCGTLTGV